MKILLTNKQMHELRGLGATVVHALNEQDLAELQAEAHTLPLHRVEDITGTGVEQHFRACGKDQMPQEGALLRLIEVAENSLNEQFPPHYRTLETPLRFNDAAVQVYPQASPGEKYAISPHLDHKECINVIVLFVLEGVAPFCICENRSGEGVREISSQPGDMIIMRGYGCMNKSRPFHFVGPVQSGTRISFGMRQLTGKTVLSYHQGDQL